MERVFLPTDVNKDQQGILHARLTSASAERREQTFARKRKLNGKSMSSRLEAGEVFVVVGLQRRGSESALARL